MKFIKRNISSDYIKEKTVKDLVVLHFTAGGTLVGAETELAKPDHINVPHIMDRDGQVYEYFNPRDGWAYHTGYKVYCRRSIGLEIVNWGALRLMFGLFLPWTEWNKDERRIDRRKAIPPERVCVCRDFRGFKYFEMLTSAQVVALPDYLDTLLEQDYPLTNIITHAEINKNKLDFPPDFEQVYDVVREYNESILMHQLPVQDNEILAGQEHLYSADRIQARINYLIKTYGWNNLELKRLVSYRDSHKSK